MSFDVNSLAQTSLIPRRSAINFGSVFAEENGGLPDGTP